MRNLFRSTGMIATVLTAVVFFASNCGDESEVIIVNLDCPALDGFQGGNYSFSVIVGEIADQCAGGIFNSLIDPGPYGPVALPEVVDLPQPITMDLPFVGEVTGSLSSDGTALKLTVPDPIQVPGIPVPGVGQVTVTARVSGILCPLTATRVDAEFTVNVQNIQPPVPLVDPPCAIRVPVTGSLQ